MNIPQTLIPRNHYTEKIRPYVRKNIAKVLTGQRRVGKSFMLFQLMQMIREEDAAANIIYINLEDFAFSHILLTAFDPTDRSQDALAQLIRERFGSLVLQEAFLHSRIVGTAGFGKETLYEYEPSTDRAAYNRAIASANAVNRAIEAAILRHWGRASGEGRPGRKEQQA